MARDTIKYKLKQSLQNQEAFGRSKHQDKIQTYQEREELKKQGASYYERLQINHMKEHIYSYNTMLTYQREVGKFGDWLIDNGYRKISIEQATEHIQDYIDYQAERGLSAWSVNTSLSAVCKATHTNVYDYERPKRTISHIERGNAPRKHDKLNEKNASHILEANRLLGMRRSELKALKASDIFTRNDKVIVKSLGKGGRYNEQIFTIPDEKKKVLALKIGKKEHEKIFQSSDFHNDADLHYERQLRSVDVYNRVVCDMKLNPECREYYKNEIHQIYSDRGRTLKENLDNPYAVRGANRQRLIAEGRETTYDRVALLYVSVTVLNHTRSDVTCAHYVSK